MPKITLLVLFFVNCVCNAQAPTNQWKKSLGGTNNESIYSECIHQTTDGGYIAVTTSNSNDGDVTGNHGGNDYWIVKLNTIGGIVWQKSLGGTGNDQVNSISQTTDGGYIVCGYSNSNDGDVTGNHGNYDYWIVKISAVGIIEWQKSFGGTNNEYAFNIKQTTDGGYIIAGVSYSTDGDVTGNHGGFDYWIVKLNTIGGIEWQKSLGGTGGDQAVSINQTTDGGYIVAGTTDSQNNGNVTGYHGGTDYWIVKLSGLGILEWQKTLGGTGDDQALSIIQAFDGGYVVVGQTYSNNGDVTVNDGYGDYWIVKLLNSGVIEWQKTFGGTDFEIAFNVSQTIDGGYILAGYSYSNDGDVSGHLLNEDYWIVKLSPFGILQWERSLGGSDHDEAVSISQTIDGGYILAGVSNSTDGFVTGNHGGNDLWIVKLNPEILSTNSFDENKNLTIYPNPAKENISIKLDYFNPSQEIAVTDILGKTIHSQKIEGLSTIINTENFESGIYFLTLSEGSDRITKKFIKE